MLSRLFLIAALMFALPAWADTVVPAGTYRGQVTSGGALSPSEVTFLPGGTTGCYSITDSSGAYAGRLSDGQAQGADRYSFTWTDKFGTGTVTYAFAEGATGFSGKWYVQGRFAGVWNAKRVPEGATARGCSDPTS